MVNETEGLIILVKDKIAHFLSLDQKLVVVESYTRVLNQLLEVKQKEVNIEHMQKSIPKI